MLSPVKRWEFIDVLQFEHPSFATLRSLMGRKGDRIGYLEAGGGFASKRDLLEHFAVYASKISEDAGSVAKVCVAIFHVEFDARSIDPHRLLDGLRKNREATSYAKTVRAVEVDLCARAVRYVEPFELSKVQRDEQPEREMLIG